MNKPEASTKSMLSPYIAAAALTLSSVAAGSAGTILWLQNSVRDGLENVEANLAPEPKILGDLPRVDKAWVEQRKAKGYEELELAKIEEMLDAGKEKPRFIDVRYLVQGAEIRYCEGPAECFKDHVSDGLGALMLVDGVLKFSPVDAEKFNKDYEVGSMVDEQGKVLFVIGKKKYVIENLPRWKGVEKPWESLEKEGYGNESVYFADQKNPEGDGVKADFILKGVKISESHEGYHIISVMDGNQYVDIGSIGLKDGVLDFYVADQLKPLACKYSIAATVDVIGYPVVIFSSNNMPKVEVPAPAAAEPPAALAEPGKEESAQKEQSHLEKIGVGRDGIVNFKLKDTGELVTAQPSLKIKDLGTGKKLDLYLVIKGGGLKATNKYGKNYLYIHDGKGRYCYAQLKNGEIETGYFDSQKPETRGILEEFKVAKFEELDDEKSWVLAFHKVESAKP